MIDIFENIDKYPTSIDVILLVQGKLTTGGNMLLKITVKTPSTLSAILGKWKR